MKEKRCSKKAVMVLMRLASMILVVSLLAVPAFAAEATYVENGAKWILTQVAWAVIVVGIVGAAFSAAKHNATAAVIIILGCAVGAFLCFRPEVIISIGNVVGGILGF